MAPDWRFADEKGRFSVKSFKGHKLSCVVDRRFPNCNKVAILCPGIYASKNHPLLLAISEGLPVNAIRFDFHGNGESEGDEDWSFGGYLEEAEDDLHAVVESCSSYDLEVVCLVGHSRASTTVLLYASLYDHIPLIISLAGRFDLKQGIEKHLKGYKGDSFKSFSVLTAGTALGKEADVLDKSLLYEQDDRNTGNISHTIKHTKQDKPTEVEEKVEYVSPDGRKRVITHKCVLNRLTLDLRNYLSKIKKTKQILVIHGSADTTIPVEDALQLANALPSGKTKVVIIEKASHDLLDTQAIRTQVIESISQFITDNGMSCKKSS